MYAFLVLCAFLCHYPGFIRKVYGILTIQLLFTAAVAAVCVLNDTVREGILNNLWTTWVGFFLTFGLLCGLLW